MPIHRIPRWLAKLLMRSPFSVIRTALTQSLPSTDEVCAAHWRGRRARSLFPLVARAEAHPGSAEG